MEARILSLPTPLPVTPTAPVPVRVDGERIVVERLVLADPALAASLAERDPDDRPALVERALRIGLLALQDAATSVDVDVVRREFEKLVAQTTAVNEHAARAVEDVLRANFADGDGRLPRTLEQFLGDRGALRQFVNELFDETRRDSAIGRIGGLLGQYFDGDRSKVAQLLDPTRLGSPLHQFRQEISEGFAGPPRAAGRDRGGVAGPRGRARPVRGEGRRLRGPAPRACSATSRGAAATCSTAPGPRPGSLLGSKKGDFVLTLNPRRHARRRRAGRARGQGPGDVAAGDARGAARGAREPRRGRRRRRLDAAPRADRHRAVRAGRATTSTWSSIPRRRTPPTSRRPCGWPGCSRSRRSRSARSTSTRRRSGGRWPACASSSRRSARSRRS